MVGRIFLGRYETVRLLGEGGMGRVYLARQTDLAGRQVVVKVMHEHIATDAKFAERFQREIHTMARFQHPYAVNLYDASGDDQSEKCIIMEYIRGITLEELLKGEKRLHPARVGRMLGQLCEVLQAAHNLGIIHRDLKPSNLMIVDGGTPYEKIKVMDFGLAKLVSINHNVTEANGEFALGTPNYLCPEQARGDEKIDHRGDLYSVGVILFELLTGRLPFTGGSTMDILLAHATEPPPAFAEVGAGDWVPPAIEAVVQACLEKEPGKRPKSARDLSEMYETGLAREQANRDRTPAGSAPPRPTGPAANRKTNAAVAVVSDPNVIEQHVDAWMPEKIATYKLQGFVQDVGGEVLECVPGRIRLRLGARGTPYARPNNSALSWLSLGRSKKSGFIDVELYLQKVDPARETLLHITILFRSHDGDLPTDQVWKARCDHVYVDLRAYLMGEASNSDT